MDVHLIQAGSGRPQGGAAVGHGRPAPRPLPALPRRGARLRAPRRRARLRRLRPQRAPPADRGVRGRPTTPACSASSSATTRPGCGSTRSATWHPPTTRCGRPRRSPCWTTCCRAAWPWASCAATRTAGSPTTPAVPGAHATTPDNAKRKDHQDAINRAIFEESVRIVKKAWTEPTFSFEGEFWTFPPKDLVQKHPIYNDCGAGVDPDGQGNRDRHRPPLPTRTPTRRSTAPSPTACARSSSGPARAASRSCWPTTWTSPRCSGTPTPRRPRPPGAEWPTRTSPPGAGCWR